MVLAVLLMAFLVGMLAFGIDLGYVMTSKAEIRRSADSAALAACWRLYDEQAAGSQYSDIYSQVTTTAAEFASANTVGGAAPALAMGHHADVVLGRYDWSDRTWDPTPDPADVNAVRVRVQRNHQMNGPVPLFFARIFGRSEHALENEATAAMAGAIRGFKLPAGDDHTLDILPFALDAATWDAMLAGETSDEWAYNEETGEISRGSDGVLEVNLYPQGTGAPGNRGTVDIGGDNNSTADIARQIRSGISAHDLAAFGRPLALDDQGCLELQGDTGISAGVKDELASIAGQTRVIPLFESVGGNGNNAVYTIVKFVGIRVLDVQLTGPSNRKHVLVQPALKMMRGAIVSRDGNDHSDFVLAPVSLVL